MIDHRPDKLVLLFSTDWFVPFWPLMGIQLKPSARRETQSLLRQEVIRAFGTKTYLDASFTPARLADTKTALVTSFPADASAAILSVVRSGLPPEVSQDVWLLAAMTDLLARTGSGSVHPETLQRVRASWKSALPPSYDWQVLCSQSRSDWDAVTRGYTPESPCWLADFVALEFQVENAFGLFWSDMWRSGSEDERRELRTWYLSSARRLNEVDRDFEALLS